MNELLRHAVKGEESRTADRAISDRSESLGHRGRQRCICGNLAKETNLWLLNGCNNSKICIIDGDKFKVRRDYRGRKGGNEFGLATENVSYTVTVRDRHMVGIFRSVKR